MTDDRYVTYIMVGMIFVIFGIGIAAFMIGQYSLENTKRIVEPFCKSYGYEFDYSSYDCKRVYNQTKEVRSVVVDNGTAYWYEYDK